MVKRVDSKRMGCGFDSYAHHDKNAIGEEGNGNYLMNSTSLEKTQNPISGFCYARNRVC